MMSRAVEEFGRKCEEKGLEKGREEGRVEGRQKGRAEGADMMAKLGEILLKADRTEDMQRAFKDFTFREKLFKEFGID